MPDSEKTPGFRPGPFTFFDNRGGYQTLHFYIFKKGAIIEQPFLRFAFHFRQSPSQNTILLAIPVRRI